MSEGDYVVREMKVGDRKEAELLADMWNRSDEGWPGGWTGGVPYTAERVLQDFMTWHHFGAWVVEYGGDIVGYVSLEANPTQPQRAYVGMLNARPDHHGRGVGRRLLLRALARSIEAGFEQVDLHTWPGNLKAVPLYKKTGFFWAPETDVHMQDFIPAIVRMPLLADFFAEHDWYRVQERDLSVCEDVEYWHRVRIYHYRFTADGQRIEVLVDRLAEMPTAIETDELSVAAWVGAEDLSALQEHTLRYEFRSKTGRPVSVSVLARGEAGVPVSVAETFELTGRHRLAIPFRLPADLERKRPGEPPHRILSTVTVGGVPIRLGTAVRKRDPVEVEGRGGGLPAGKWTDIRINLRNRLPFPVSGALSVGSAPEVERTEEKLAFRIPRGGRGSVSLRLRAREVGAHALELCVNLSRETARRLAKGETPALPARGRVQRAWLRAFAPGTFVASRDEENRIVTVESDRMTVAFHQAGGWLQVREKVRGRQLMSMRMPEVGPPFGTFSPVPKIYETETRQVDGQIHLVTRQQEERHPGLTLERILVVTPGLLEVRHRLLNVGAESTRVQVRTSVYGGLGPARLTIPRGEGVLQHESVGWGDWPVYGELRERPEEYAESWVAAEYEGAVVGVIWEGVKEIRPGNSGGAAVTYGPLSVPAGGSVETPPLRLVAGWGDYRTVRSVWATYVRPEPLRTPEEREPATRKLIRGGLNQVPALLGGSPRRMTVELIGEQGRALEGEAELTLPPVVKSSAVGRSLRFGVRGLAKGSPWRRPVTLRPTAKGPTAAEGELRFASRRESYRFPVPVIIVRTGRRGLTLRHTDDTVSVDTGWLRFVVSAGHAGSVVSLARKGRELLRSSYPTPRPYGYMNPWYGGVRGYAGSSWDRRLLDVRSHIEPVRVIGSEGWRWQGAQVTTSPTHADWRWLRYRVKYLTTPGSNLLAVLVSAENRTSAGMGVRVAVEVWPRLGASPAYVEHEGEPRPYRPDRHSYGARSTGWVAFDCGRGAMLTVVARREPDWRLELENHGQTEFNASVGRWVNLTPPVRRLSSMAWVVACQRVEEAHAYRFLSELGELP